MAGLVVGQGAVVVVSDNPGLRADAMVGAVKSALGLGAVLLTPFRPGSAASELARLPARTPAERRAKLAAAERWLKDAADDEALVTGWTARVAASVVNLAGTYYLWIEEERFGSGWLALGTGMAVSEVQIRTAPTGALDATRRPQRAAERTPWTLAVSPGPGLTLTGSF